MELELALVWKRNRGTTKTVHCLLCRIILKAFSWLSATVVSEEAGAYLPYG